MCRLEVCLLQFGSAEIHQILQRKRKQVFQEIFFILAKFKVFFTALGGAEVPLKFCLRLNKKNRLRKTV